MGGGYFCIICSRSRWVIGRFGRSWNGCHAVLPYLMMSSITFRKIRAKTMRVQLFHSTLTFPSWGCGLIVADEETACIPGKDRTDRRTLLMGRRIVFRSEKPSQLAKSLAACFKSMTDCTAKNKTVRGLNRS